MRVVLASLAATLCIQIGYFLWKLSADRLPRIGHAPASTVVRALLTEPRWLAGLVATTAGWLLFIHATALGEISVVQPLMSAGDLLLVLLAVTFLHERLYRFEWAGIALIVIGAVALATGADDRGSATVDSLRLTMLIAGASLLAVALTLRGRKYGHAEVTMGLAVGLAFGAGAVLTEAMTTLRAKAGLAAVEWSIVLDPMLVGVVATNIAGLALLQAAFQRGRASVIVPLQLAVANGVTVLAAVTAFDETVTLGRTMAIALILAGTALLHLRPHGGPAA